MAIKLLKAQDVAEQLSIPADSVWKIGLPRAQIPRRIILIVIAHRGVDWQSVVFWIYK